MPRATLAGTVLASSRRLIGPPHMTTPPHANPGPDHADRAQNPLIGRGAAPRWSTYTVTFLGSLGTGAVMNGLYFLSTNVYDFGRVANWTLAIVASVAYVLAALYSGPAIRCIQRAVPGCSMRTILAVQTAMMALACALPYFVQQAWTIWVFGIVYSVLSGALWPIVESFLSGGRRGSELRRATGGFNIVWSLAVAFSFWGMALIIEQAPLRIIALLGLVHLLTLPLLAAFPREPGRHHELHAYHDPAEAERYRRLLHGFRLLLLVSYAAMSAIGPVLPLRLTELEVPLARQTLIASIWMTVRIAVFALMMVWGGWHGRIRTMVWSSAAMLSGFALAMVGPGLISVMAGLALLGIGVGAAYSAAIYYAMEVGDAAVDAGGKHEALIGVGYLAGPGLSLIAAAGIKAGWIANPVWLDVAAAIAVSGLAVVLIALAFWLARPRRESVNL